MSGAAFDKPSSGLPGARVTHMGGKKEGKDRKCGVPLFLNICHNNCCMASTESFSRAAMIMVAVSKSKSLPSMQIHTAREAGLFQRFIPYSFGGGKTFDLADKNFLLDANQRMFNIVAKLDHTHVNLVPNGKAEVSSVFRGKAAPVASALEALSGYQLPQSGLLDMYALKMALLASISKSVELLSPLIDPITRIPNFGNIPGSPYLRRLNLYVGMLSRHFQDGSSFFLYGSAAKGAANPSDADFTIVVPRLDSAAYEENILYAANIKSRTAKTIPLTFSIIPSRQFMHFAMSDMDSKYLLSITALYGRSIDVPFRESIWRDSIVRAAVLQAALRLREALADWQETAKNPNVLKARLNEPLYALSSLKNAFGERQCSLDLQKFSPSSVDKYDVVEPLIAANLAMQEILNLYSDKLDKQ